MKNLFTLLERFSKSLNKDSLAKESIIETIKARTRVTLDTSSISVKEGVLEITASPVAKNEITLKEEIIKEELKHSKGISILRIAYK